MATESPHNNKRVQYKNGAYRYDNADGSTYYNDGRGFEEYRHPDPSRNWTRTPAVVQDADSDDGDSRGQSGSARNSDHSADEDGPHGYDSPAQYSDDGYDHEAIEDHYEPAPYIDHGYGDDDDPMDIDQPPPYTEYDPIAMQEPPRMPKPLQAKPKATAKKAVKGATAKGPIPKEKAVTKSKPPIQGAKKTPQKAAATKRATPAKKLEPKAVPKSAPKASKSDSRKAVPKKATPKKDEPKAIPKKAESKKPAPKKAEVKQIEVQGEKKCAQCREPGHDRRNCPLNELKGLVGAGYSHNHSHTHTTTTTTTTTTTASSVKGGVISGRVTKPKPKPKTNKPAAKAKPVKPKK